MKQLLLKFLGSLGNYLKVLFEGALKAQLDALMPIATNAVKMIAKDPSLLTSNEKRDAAISMILADIAKAQIQVSQSVVNLATELAYQNFKREQVK
jgi:hypothetical protein